MADRFLATPLLAVTLTAAGCGAGQTSMQADGARVDTIAGVVHVTNGARGAWDDDAAWEVDVERAVRIGVVDGEAEYVFGRIGGVWVAPDGRIFVGDAQAREVRIFTPEGEFLGRLGRTGEGPGEFRHVDGIGAAPGGGVAVLDGMLNRVSVFDGDGAFRRMFRLARPYRFLQAGASVRFDDAGRFYDVIGLSIGIGVDTLGVVRYSPEGAAEDTVVVAVHEPVQLHHRAPDGRPLTSMKVPFTPEPSAAIGPDGSHYATLGDAYRIARLAPGGDTIHVIHRAVPPRRLDPAVRESARAALVEHFRAAAGSEPRDVPPIPEHAPAISRLVVDDLGFVWALVHGGEDRFEWDVFDRDGRFLGTVTTPAMDVTHIGERTIAGVVSDEMGVQRVLVVPLRRG